MAAYGTSEAELETQYGELEPQYGELEPPYVRGHLSGIIGGEWPGDPCAVFTSEAA